MWWAVWFSAWKIQQFHLDSFLFYMFLWLSWLLQSLQKVFLPSTTRLEACSQEGAEHTFCEVCSAEWYDSLPLSTRTLRLDFVLCFWDSLVFNGLFGPQCALAGSSVLFFISIAHYYINFLLICLLTWQQHYIAVQGPREIIGHSCMKIARSHLCL